MAVKIFDIVSDIIADLENRNYTRKLYSKYSVLWHQCSLQLTNSFSSQLFFNSPKVVWIRISQPSNKWSNIKTKRWLYTVCMIISIWYSIQGQETGVDKAVGVKSSISWFETDTPKQYSYTNMVGPLCSSVCSCIISAVSVFLLRLTLNRGWMSGLAV